MSTFPLSGSSRLMSLMCLVPKLLLLASFFIRGVRSTGFQALFVFLPRESAAKAQPKVFIHGFSPNRKRLGSCTQKKRRTQRLDGLHAVKLCGPAVGPQKKRRMWQLDEWHAARS